MFIAPLIKESQEQGTTFQGRWSCMDKNNKNCCETGESNQMCGTTYP